MVLYMNLTCFMKQKWNWGHLINAIFWMVDIVYLCSNQELLRSYLLCSVLLQILRVDHGYKKKNIYIKLYILLITSPSIFTLEIIPSTNFPKIGRDCDLFTYKGDTVLNSIWIIFVKRMKNSYRWEEGVIRAKGKAIMFIVQVIMIFLLWVGSVYYNLCINTQHAQNRYV